MSDDPQSDRITRLETQLDASNRQYNETLGNIYERLNALAVAIAPNAINLARLERLEVRIVAIEKWQNKVIGVATLAVILITLFGPVIRKSLSLE